MALNSQYKAVAASYGRSVLAAVAALYVSGNTNVTDYAKALIVAVAPVILRYLNKNDIAFGRGYTPEQLADVVVDTVVKATRKAPVKAAPVSKPATKPAPKTPAKKNAETTTKGKTTK
jgi:hypothetical protein